MTRLLIAAFDGLLPQQVNADLTPTINRLADVGVQFRRHHSVFPTVTRINSAAMVTGCYPGKHGIPANRAVFADWDPHSVMDVLQPGLSAMAANPETPVLFVPTIGEILESAGMSHVSIVGGTSGNAYVHFPRASKAGRGGVIHPEFSLPAELGKADCDALGPWPATSVPGIERINRVADSACNFVIPGINPDLLFVWFPEPDSANHAHGIGSEQSNQGTAAADAALSRILETLEAQGDNPDVMIVSDHGYSTISGVVDVFSELKNSGFAFDQGEGSLLVGNNGGSVLFDYPGAESNDIEKLMNWLRDRHWAGAVFSSLQRAQDLGALPVEEAFLAGVHAPHFVVSMNWEDRPAGNGFSGTAFNSGGSPLAAGLHGSASPYEIRNTLIASGPSFKQASASSAPSGNIDLAPTALRLLGQPVPSHMDGRVLEEALIGGPDSEQLAISETIVRGSELPAVAEVARVGGRATKTRYYARKVAVSDHEYLESAGVETS